MLAKIDVDANQLIAQQFGIQGIPAVMAVVAGQLVPLFQGAENEANVRQVLDQLIMVAEQRFGVVGGTAGTVGAGAPAAPAAPGDPALNAAHEALDRGDLGGAIQAYQNVLDEQPGNTEAQLGLAQAELLRRVEGFDAQAVRTAAADNPPMCGPSWTRPTWSWWAAMSRTPSDGCWTPWAGPPAPTGTSPGCVCWSCSR